ncbi:hypothetical protein [Neoroseomonas soli]|uniref:Uncharacterized protein n=1 Tax=Neoroseomonas soli TaxID=1081025 RepID=A0A9X9WR05_9PROT|nr:hypothetical protein [Neoroseomonas soli]MBR0669584.1 hypothetical protein [Neoroseomonas soli]
MLRVLRRQFLRPVFLLQDRYEFGDPNMPPIANAATHGGANDWGNSSRGRCSNPELDALFERAQSEIEPQAREPMLQQAMRIVVEDVAMIPIFRPRNLDAMRDNIDRQPVSDG